VSGGGEVQVTFEEWTRGRALPYVGTNAGAVDLPFQAWRHFKEAFAPEIVAQAILESSIPVTKCLDPFGGSGTTGLACQFLGVHPILAEVNLPCRSDHFETHEIQLGTSCTRSERYRWHRRKIQSRSYTRFQECTAHIRGAWRQWPMDL
jgi:hypothetical protein